MGIPRRHPPGWRNALRRLIAFAGIGLLGTGLHVAVLVGAVRGAGIGPVPASCGGALAGALLNYGLNHRFNYRSQRAHRQALPRFLLIATVAFALNAALMALGTGALRLNYLLAQGLTSALVLAWTFTANHRWSF
jgi:putative flippase GtrA